MTELRAEVLKCALLSSKTHVNVRNGLFQSLCTVLPEMGAFEIGDSKKRFQFTQFPFCSDHINTINNVFFSNDIRMFLSPRRQLGCRP